MEENGKNNTGHNSHFGLPGDYFDHSARNLASRLLWLEEHREYPALKMAWRNDLFCVPETYFEKNEAKLENLPFEKLNSISKGNAFAVPPGYFETFSVQDLNGALAGLVKELPFAVPESYFKDAAARLSKLNNPGNGRIIPLRRRYLSFAAAAALLLVAGLWMYNAFFSEKVVDPDCGGIACVDRNELLQRKNLESLDEDQLYELVNARALENQLNNNKPEAVTKDSALSEEDLLDNI